MQGRGYFGGSIAPVPASANHTIPFSLLILIKAGFQPGVRDRSPNASDTQAKGIAAKKRSSEWRPFPLWTRLVTLALSQGVLIATSHFAGIRHLEKAKKNLKPPAALRGLRH